MAMEILATTLGLPDYPGLAWDQRENQRKLPGMIYKTQNFAISRREQGWALDEVLSAAVLIL